MEYLMNKLMAFLVFFVSVSLVSFSAFATCTDGVQDGAEVGIDCGVSAGCGPCFSRAQDWDRDDILDENDNCIYAPNPAQNDFDQDGLGDACEGNDQDGDGVADNTDNCPFDFNPSQGNSDGDIYGDACEDVEDSVTVAGGDSAVQHIFEHCTASGSGMYSAFAAMLLFGALVILRRRTA